MRYWNIFILVLLLGTAFGVQAEDGIPDNCEYSDEANLMPRYDANTQRFVLVNWNTGAEVREMETIPEMQSQFGILEWAPNCRYLTGLIYVGLGNDAKLLLWDTTNGQLLQTLGYPRTMAHKRISFSPNGEQAIFRTTDGYYIWTAVTNGLTLLTHAEGRGWGAPNVGHVFWDYERGQVILQGNPGVIAYDLMNGSELHLFFTAEGVGEDSDFDVSPDRTKIVVFTDPMSSDRRQSFLSVWDLNSLTNTEVNINNYAALPEQMALSPDNRYLVMGSRSLLRVWDMQNLPENVADRNPIYIHGGPEAAIGQLSVSDAGVIETVSDEGVQHWDLHTGVYIAAAETVAQS